MPGVRVGRGARIRRAVVDENVEIPDGAEIGYDREMDRRQFRLNPGGVIVVSGGYSILSKNLAKSGRLSSSRLSSGKSLNSISLELSPEEAPRIAR